MLWVPHAESAGWTGSASHISENHSQNRSESQNDTSFKSLVEGGQNRIEIRLVPSDKTTAGPTRPKKRSRSASHPVALFASKLQFGIGSERRAGKLSSPRKTISSSSSPHQLRRSPLAARRRPPSAAGHPPPLPWYTMLLAAATATAAPVSSSSSFFAATTRATTTRSSAQLQLSLPRRCRSWWGNGKARRSSRRRSHHCWYASTMLPLPAFVELSLSMSRELVSWRRVIMQGRWRRRDAGGPHGRAAAGERPLPPVRGDRREAPGRRRRARPPHRRRVRPNHRRGLHITQDYLKKNS